MSARHERWKSEAAVRLPTPDINEALLLILSEALLYAGTERGRLAFERLTHILTRPAWRIARTKLETVLPRDQVRDELIDDLVNVSMQRLYVKLSYYEPRTQVIPWFAGLVEECTRELVRRGRQ